MKITNLKVQNFKAFYGEIDKPYEFNFLGKDGDAKNILLYGENGSGKSSLYWTLHHALTTTDSNIFKKYKNIFAQKKEKDIRLLSKLKKREWSSTIDLTNFQYSKSELYKQPIKIEIDFDNGKKFVYDENTGITVDADTQEEFDRLTKIKTFLTYDSIFLINELFSKEISIERFIYILNLLYGESLHELLEEYNQHRKEFKNTYLKDLCHFEKIFEDFNEKYKIDDLFMDKFYENTPKLDEESDEPIDSSYETIYYFPDDMISDLETLITSLDTIKDEFGIKSKNLNAILDGLGGHLYTMEEKSESYYMELIDNKEIHTDNFEAIDIVDTINTLEKHIGSYITLITDDYEIGVELASDLNEKLNSKINSQIPFVNDILRDNFKCDIFLGYESIDFFGFFIDDLDYFYPLKLKIKTNNEVIPHRYAKFLNEAKISSINLAFYISIIKSYPELKELKLLVLDDLLISLDMSNRDIVLNILQEYFSDYQIILLTHDRAFFEMARRKLKPLKLDETWIEYEMFEDSSGAILKPLIMPFEGHLEQAETYFKICDYPAAGNYLRKASEEILSSMLLDTFKPNDKSGLDGMIKAYKTMCTVFAINISPYILSLEELTQRVFNPSSHDDLVSPLYKKEIHDAIELVRNVDQLEKIEKIETTIRQGSLLAFKYEDKYEAFYRFLGEVQLYTYGGHILNRDSILLCKTGHKILVGDTWEEHTHGNNESFRLKTIFGRNKHFCENKLGLPEINIASFVDNVLINDSILDSEIKSLIKGQIQT